MGQNRTVKTKAKNQWTVNEKKILKFILGHISFDILVIFFTFTQGDTGN